jgi:hypothetical protein
VGDDLLTTASRADKLCFGEGVDVGYARLRIHGDGDGDGELDRGLSFDFGPGRVGRDAKLAGSANGVAGGRFLARGTAAKAYQQGLSNGW